MKQYSLQPGRGIDALQIIAGPTMSLQANEVRVAMSAAALNFRDLQVAQGIYGKPGDLPDHAIVPVADGAGTVIEIGAAVTRFRPGDRVITTYSPNWLDGPGSPEQKRVSYGAQIDGVLAEHLVAHEDGLVRAPDSLTNIEAATLPCAGVTAWNALFRRGQARPGDTVLLLGTGGVAIWGLQIAVAAGLNPIVTSSSYDKLERARELGARHTVNYKTTPEWQDAVLDVTNGRGADVVLELGGRDTLPRSVKATGFDGRVVVIGGLTGFGAAEVGPGDLIDGLKTITSVSVGSRAATEELVRFVDLHGIKPVVDRTFGFEDAIDAYHHLEAGRAFGKVVVSVP